MMTFLSLVSNLLLCIPPLIFTNELFHLAAHLSAIKLHTTCRNWTYNIVSSFSPMEGAHTVLYCKGHAHVSIISMASAVCTYIEQGQIQDFQKGGLRVMAMLLFICIVVLCDNRKSVIVAVINIIVIVIIKFFIIVRGNCSEKTSIHCKKFSFGREICN